MISLTFDVEERFHSHLTPTDAPRDWSAGERTRAILDALEAAGHRATFFVVGEFAERYPELVRRMAGAGFEVASHSHSHPRLDGDDRAFLKRDIARSKDVLEQLTGRPVVGFRAPSWTARLDDDWLWDHLIALGIRYDSSLFPFATHAYGSNRNPVAPFRLRPELYEIPPSVSRFGPLRVPYGGGFYFRLYPLWLTRRLIARAVRGGATPIVYFHPWEFDRGATTMEADALNRFIGNYNSAGMWDKFTRLLSEQRSTALCDVMAMLDAREVRSDAATDGAVPGSLRCDPSE